MRLELENKQLKSGGGIEKIMELENKLDDTARLNNKYAQVSRLSIYLSIYLSTYLPNYLFLSLSLFIFISIRF